MLRRFGITPVPLATPLPLGHSRAQSDTSLLFSTLVHSENFGSGADHSPISGSKNRYEPSTSQGDEVDLPQPLLHEGKPMHYSRIEPSAPLGSSWLHLNSSIHYLNK
jgi:hypothetical protein